MVGKSLIESAQINSQVKQFQQYDIALKGFYSKFKGIPGDTTKILILGNSGGCWVGNNDGVMTDFIGRTPINWLLSEASCYFQVLRISGLINEKHIMYNYDPVTFRVGLGTEFPLIKLNDDKTRGMLALTNRAGDVFYFMGLRERSQHSNPQVGTASLKDGTPTPPSGVISPPQAASLDQKMDDGLPSTGNVAASTNATNTTAGRFYPFNLDTTTCVSAGAYNLAITNNETCRMQVKADNYR